MDIGPLRLNYTHVTRLVFKHNGQIRLFYLGFSVHRQQHIFFLSISFHTFLAKRSFCLFLFVSLQNPKTHVSEIVWKIPQQHFTVFHNFPNRLRKYFCMSGVTVCMVCPCNWVLLLIIIFTFG